MRTSVLSRSLIAATGLAVAAATLASVPASAAPGVTRGQVLAAAAAVRADGAATLGTKSASTNRTLRTLSNQVCAVDHSAEAVVLPIAIATQAGEQADGLMVGAVIVDLSVIISFFNATPEPTLGDLSELESEMPNPDTIGRLCVFGALAATDVSSSLSGTATLDLLGASSYNLSGDVYVTPARNLRYSELMTLLSGSSEAEFTLPSFKATGNATKVTPTKVSTPKTTKQKKAAKKAYDKALKSAKKSYTKALKKAGDSKKKKSAAKKAYSKKKATANAKYRSAIATFKIVNNSASRAFSVAALFPDMELPPIELPPVELP